MTATFLPGAWHRYTVAEPNREEIGTIALRSTEHAGTLRAVFKARRHVQLTPADLRAVADLAAALEREHNPKET